MEINKAPLWIAVGIMLLAKACFTGSAYLPEKIQVKIGALIKNPLIKAIGCLKRIAPSWLKRIVRPYVFFWNMRKVLPSITKKDIVQALNVWATLRANITGRVCGEVGDSLAQYLTVVQYARQTGIRNIDSLEIGTLFGGSCLMKLCAARNLGCSGVAICIDPMDGFITYAVHLELDPRAGIPINPETFYSNIKKFGFLEQDVKLITEFSDSPDAFKELKESSYATLLIDGNHSFDCVKYDWEHYHRYVAAGGFVLFDDYGRRTWPAVGKFVNHLIASLPLGWKVCGTIGKTMILQREK